MEQMGVQYFSSTALPVGFEKKRIATTDVTKNEVSPKKMAQMKTGGTQKNEVMSAKKPQIYLKMPPVNICCPDHQQAMYRAQKNRLRTVTGKVMATAKNMKARMGIVARITARASTGTAKGLALSM